MERKHFEVTAILKPEGGAEAVKQFAERVDGIVNEFGGKIITLRSWGEKKLAYEIKKNMKGHYLLFDLVGDGKMIEEVERNFNIWEHVIKFMSIRVEKKENLDELINSARGISTLFEKVEKKQPVAVVEAAPAEEDREKKSLEDSRKYNEQLQKTLNTSSEEDDKTEL